MFLVYILTIVNHSLLPILSYFSIYFAYFFYHYTPTKLIMNLPYPTISVFTYNYHVF